MDTEDSIIYLQSSAIVSISNLNADSVILDTVDTLSNYIITIDTIDISGSEPSTIENVNIENSDVGFLKIILISDDVSTSESSLVINNMTMSD